MSRRALSLWIVLPALVAGVVWLAPAWAFPPPKPYDPRPLMAEVEKRFTQDKFTFLILGDIQYARDLPAVAKFAESLSPAFVLFTGDVVGGASTGIYDQIDAQLGPFMRRVPSCPTLGNHEISRVEGLAMYRQFYGFDATRYTVDFRHARFITLCTPGGGFPESQKEMTWLESQLVEGRKAGKLLFVWQHCPAYTVGIKRPREISSQPTAFTKMCTKYGVVADFAGHDHTYYRTSREGVTYIVQATTGPKLYPLNRRAEALPQDVYYGGGEKSGALLHTPGGDRTFDRAVRTLTAISVDGPHVTGRTITLGGEVLDEFTIAPAPAAAPSSRPASRPATQPAGAR